jgi:hypothetical protein
MLEHGLFLQGHNVTPSKQQQNVFQRDSNVARQPRCRGNIYGDIMKMAIVKVEREAAFLFIPITPNLFL